MEGLNNVYLDDKERDLIEKLAEDYKKFIQPNALQMKLQQAKEMVSEHTPQVIKESFDNTIKAASEWNVIIKALEKANKGAVLIQENTSKHTLSKKRVIDTFTSRNMGITSLDDICKLKSYEIEKIVVNHRKKIDMPAAFFGGGLTGFFGLYGLPFNLAFTFLMYFRTVQSVGLYYGYDVTDDPRELEIASNVTITCLSPSMNHKVKNLSTVIEKMMLATKVTTLRESLSKLSYTEMAKRGGEELLYVQLRALANKQAQKALKDAGQKELEAGIFKKMLEQLGKHMSQNTGKKAIPIIGGVIGACYDTYMIDRIIKGANLIYHKRFLHEKNIRNEELKNKAIILDYDEILNRENTEHDKLPTFKLEDIPILI